MTEDEEIESFRLRERLLRPEDRLRLSGIPRRFHGATLLGYQPVPQTSRAHAECLRYETWFREHWQDGVGMAFIGSPGTHKTTLSCTLAAEIARVGYAVRYTTLDAYVRMHQRRMSADRLRDLESERLQALRDSADVEYTDWVYRRAAYLLVFDDVGKEHRGASGWAASLFDSVCRERYDLGLPTFVSSNIGLDHWADEYSPAMRSFVHEMCQVIVFKGFDSRGRKVLSAGG